MICEIEALKSLRHDYENYYPQWLTKGPHRRYVALWVLGHRAKCGDTAVSQVKEIVKQSSVYVSPVNIKVSYGAETFLNRSTWTSVDDIWDSFPNLKVLPF